MQIIDDLVAKIENDTLLAETRLPSEKELGVLYAVSRTTVRQALHALESDGYVHIYKGRGTFVAAKRLNQEMSGLYGFTESMKRLGKTVSTKLVDFEQIQCDERIARKMQCPVETALFRFTRVRYADNEPMLIVTTHLPCSRFPGLNADDLAARSLYAIMRDVHHVNFTKANETLQSVRVRHGEAMLLQVEADAPCMKIARHTYEKESLIEYAVGIARGDKFQYNVELN